MLSKFIFDSVDRLLDRFDRELEELQIDLNELSKNRKYNWVEAETILTIDGYLDFVIERLMGFALDGSVPESYQDKAMKLIQRAKEVRFFIYDNFEDIFRGTYKPETA